MKRNVYRVSKRPGSSNMPQHVCDYVHHMMLERAKDFLAQDRDPVRCLELIDQVSQNLFDSIPPKVAKFYEQDFDADVWGIGENGRYGRPKNG